MLKICVWPGIKAGSHHNFFIPGVSAKAFWCFIPSSLFRTHVFLMCFATFNKEKQQKVLLLLAALNYTGVKKGHWNTWKTLCNHF